MVSYSGGPPANSGQSTLSAREKAAKAKQEKAAAERDKKGLVPAKEIARIFNVKERTVRAWQDDGCPVAHRGGGRGNPNLFDLAAVKAWRDEFGTGGVLDLTAEKTLLTRAQRQEAEVRVKKALRELVPIEEVEQLWLKMIGAARAKLLNLPTKAAPLVLSCDDMAEVQAVLSELVREALNDVSGDGTPERGLLQGMETTTEPDGQPVG